MYVIETITTTADSRCSSYEYRRCTGGSASRCNLSGEYSPRQGKRTLREAKEFCESHSDCFGITKDNGGYEPRRGPNIGRHVAAHELWLCKGIRDE